MLSIGFISYNADWKEPTLSAALLYVEFYSTLYMAAIIIHYNILKFLSVHSFFIYSNFAP